MLLFLNLLVLIPPILMIVAVVLFLWDKPVIVIYSQITYNCIMRFLISQFHVPVSIKYFTDVLTLLLLVQLLLCHHQELHTNIRKPLLLIGVFTMVILVSFVGNTVANDASMVFFLWGIRIYYRFFVFFMACIRFLQSEDIERLLKFLVVLLPFNAAASSYQYFVQGYTFDFNGGLFGFEAGCNGPMSLYLLLTCTILTVGYVNGKMRRLPTLIGLAIILYISALSELKFMFFSVVGILVVVAILSFPNKRAIFLAVSGCVLVSLAIPLFLIFYPSWSDFFNIASIEKYTTVANYGGGTGLNRLSAGPYIWENIITTMPGRLFGIGLGNADYFLSFNSPFYLKYRHLHYDYFTYVRLMVEVGIVGLVVYMLFYAAVLVDSIRIMRCADAHYKPFCYISLVMSAVSFLLMIYNQSVRTEVAYILFFSLAVPYIIEKDRNRHLSKAANLLKKV